MPFSPKNAATSPSQLRHGVHYLSREKQPSMFEILSWQHNPAQSNEWLLKMQPDYSEPKFTEPQKYQRPHQHRQKEARGELKGNEKSGKSHKLLHQLYYYGDERPKDKIAQGIVDVKKEKTTRRKAAKKLDQFDKFQKRQIEIRSKNIQRFACHTRQLPDSAFTTYFGKPAFAPYAIGSSSDAITKRKSHSVMPHAGTNHPLSLQSHEGALNRANVINLNLKVPKKPGFSPQLQNCRVKVSEYYNVEIVKPDLVNQAKFANEEAGLRKKERTPKHNEINVLPARTYASPQNANTEKSRRQGRKGKASSQEKEDGLSFMHRREHFRKEMEEKKKNQNRIAYKPTECYPLDWEHQTEAQSTHRLEKWKQLPPAGVSSERYLKAQSLWHA